MLGENSVALGERCKTFCDWLQIFERCCLVTKERRQGKLLLPHCATNVEFPCDKWSCSNYVLRCVGDQYTKHSPAVRIRPIWDSLAKCSSNSPAYVFHMRV